MASTTPPRLGSQLIVAGTTRTRDVTAGGGVWRGVLVAVWETLVGSLAAFTEPGFETVFSVVHAWVLTAGRHTLRRMFLVGGERNDWRGYDRFTYLVREGA